jgi:hypothetical protein
LLWPLHWLFLLLLFLLLLFLLLFLLLLQGCHLPPLRKAVRWLPPSPFPSACAAAAAPPPPPAHRLLQGPQ